MIDDVKSINHGVTRSWHGVEPASVICATRVIYCH